MSHPDIYYPERVYRGEGGLASARVSEGQTMTDEERAAFFVRHDTYGV